MSEEAEFERHVSIRWLAFSLLPLAIFVGTETLLSAVGDYQITFDSEALKPSYQLVESGGRYYVIAAGLLHISVCLSVFVVFLSDMKGYSKESHRNIAVFYLPLCLSVVGYVTLAHIFTDQSPTHYLLDKTLFEVFLAGNNVPFCTDSSGNFDPTKYFLWDQCNGSSVLSLFRFGTDLVSIATAIGAPAAILGVLLSTTTVAYRRMLDTEERRVASIKNIQRNKRLIRKYTLLSAIILTTGIVYIYSWTSWPIRALNLNAADNYSFLSSGIVIFYGVSNSLVLASYLVPAAFAHNRHVDATGRIVLKQPDSIDESGVMAIDTWKQATGLSTGHLDVLRYSTALVLPLAPGVLGFVTDALLLSSG